MKVARGMDVTLDKKRQNAKEHEMPLPGSKFTIFMERKMFKEEGK